MTDRKITVAKNKDEALKASAEIFVRAIADAAAKKERVSIALSGGNTPRGLYLLLSDPSSAYFSQIAWEKLDFFWSDERFVPADDKDSNFRMAKETLLDRAPLAPVQIHRMVTENVSPEQCAQTYQGEIQKFFNLKDLSEVPVFDLMLLGMGPDGHTASLFPDLPLEEMEHGPFSDCWVKSFYVPHLKDKQPLRISFTPKLINASANIVYLVLGADKADAFKRVQDPAQSPYSVPAKLISPKNGKMFWVVDQEVTSREKIAS